MSWKCVETLALHHEEGFVSFAKWRLTQDKIETRKLDIYIGVIYIDLNLVAFEESDKPPLNVLKIMILVLLKFTINSL